MITLGVLSAGMGLHGFLLSSNFIDGGVTGVSMLLAKVTPFSLSFWLPVINLPFVAVGYRHIGATFALRSLLAIVGLAVALFFIPYPDVTHDLVLTAIFGGFFIGAGIGLAVRGGAVLDGTEIAALAHQQAHPPAESRRRYSRLQRAALSRSDLRPRRRGRPLLHLDVRRCGKNLDFVIYGLEEYTAITIVSRQSHAIREVITRELGRGVTVIKGYGGMSGEEQNILYCVVTRLEIGKVRGIVKAIDAAAFVAYHALANAEGGVVKKTGLQ